MCQLIVFYIMFILSHSIVVVAVNTNHTEHSSHTGNIIDPREEEIVLMSACSPHT